MTFDETVDAMRLRLGQRVKVTFEEKGQISRTDEGVLRPGRDGATEATPEDDGRFVYRVAPQSHWFQLVPSVFLDAQEDDNYRLRVEMVGGSAFVIEA
ncbi:MAG TPA: hypothetical protein VK774_08685 [Solirubrobacteraceae bacterium]|jgi:hypothetical protein|nr:hypothetical protein [Solirubrobacteraceae bacterium]